MPGVTGTVLFAKRPEGGLFGGLWEPPMVEGVVSVREARPRLAAMGIPLGRGKLREAGVVTHVLTHRRMDVTVVTGERQGGATAVQGGYEKAAWLDPGAPGVGVSTLARKVIAAARREAGGGGRGRKKG